MALKSFDDGDNSYSGMYNSVLFDGVTPYFYIMDRITSSYISFKLIYTSRLSKNVKIIL